MPTSEGLSNVEAFVGRFAPTRPCRPLVRELYVLLTLARADASLDMRVEWLEHLGRWILSRDLTPPLPGALEDDDSRTARLKFLIEVMHKMPDVGERMGATIRSVLEEGSLLRLWCSTGLPTERGFFVEAIRRAFDRLLPDPPDVKDLTLPLLRLFHREDDAQWLKTIPAPVLSDVTLLLAPTSQPLKIASIEQAQREAIALIAARVGATGLADDIRARCPEVPLRESPFLLLPRFCQELMDASPEDSAHLAQEVRALIESCRKVTQAVLDHLEQQGVSVDVVFRLETMTKGLDRLEALLSGTGLSGARVDGRDESRFVADLLSDLLLDAHRERSLRALVKSNSRQLSRKIIERAGATGEHYITSSRAEYWGMLASACGGGILTCGTAALKFAISSLALPPFFNGVAESLNYAGSFLLMQLLGFTLATKQPSMTAAALAGTLKERKTGEGFDAFGELVARITRSQLAAAFGNVGAVIPTTLAFHALYRLATGRTFLDLHQAEYVVHSLHPVVAFGFAALTGVFLWVASVGAGWLENWTVYRRLPEALAHHRWIRKALGRERAQKWGHTLSHEVSGIGGNVTLGTLLGMTPAMKAFFGIPLEARHVTLSTGALVLAACALEPDQLLSASFAWASFGILLIGSLNFGVSFALALAVAARARDVSLADAGLFKALWHAVRRSPKLFVLPPPEEPATQTLAIEMKVE